MHLKIFSQSLRHAVVVKPFSSWWMGDSGCDGHNTIQQSACDVGGCVVQQIRLCWNVQEWH